MEETITIGITFDNEQSEEFNIFLSEEGKKRYMVGELELTVNNDSIVVSEIILVPRPKKKND